MMKCRHGHEIPDSSSFCSRCTADQREPLRWLKTPARVDIVMVPGAANKERCTATLESIGPWPVQVKLSRDPASTWLELTPTDLSIQGGECAQIALLVDPKKVTDGDQGSIDVAWNGPSTGAWRSQATINVVVTFATPSIEAPEVVEVPAGETAVRIPLRNTGGTRMTVSSKCVVKAGDPTVLSPVEATATIDPATSADLVYSADYSAFGDDDQSAEVLVEVQAPGLRKDVVVRLQRQMNQSLAVGIDFGTTNSSIAYVPRGSAEVKVLPIDHAKLVPSVVVLAPNTADYRADAFEIYDDCVVHVGRRAVSLMDAPDPKIIVVRSVKRQIAEDPPPFTIPVRRNGVTQNLAPTDFASMIIRCMLDRLREATGENITKALVTYPNGWTDDQIEATRLAAKKAGLQVSDADDADFMPEAAAAAHSAIAVANPGDKGQLILVIDFGGGTLDVVLIERSRGTIKGLPCWKYVTVPGGQGGDRELGGDDVDEIIIDWLLRQAQRTEEVRSLRQARPGSPQYALYFKLKQLAEQAKIKLSTSDQALISADISYDSDVVRINTTLQRGVYNDLIRPLIDRAIECIQKTLTAANKTASEVNIVFMVGGSSHIVEYARRVTNLFGNTPVHHHPQVQTGIAEGAARYRDDLRHPGGGSGQGQILAQGRLRYAVGMRLSDQSFKVLLAAGTPYGEESEEHVLSAPPGTVASLAIYQYTRDDRNPDNSIIDGGRSNGWLAIKTEPLPLPARFNDQLEIRVKAAVTRIGAVSITAYWLKPATNTLGTPIEIKAKLA